MCVVCVLCQPVVGRSLSLSHSHTHTNAYIHTYTQSVALSLSLTHTHTHERIHTYIHTHTSHHVKADGAGDAAPGRVDVGRPVIFPCHGRGLDDGDGVALDVTVVK